MSRVAVVQWSRRDGEHDLVAAWSRAQEADRVVASDGVVSVAELVARCRHRPKRCVSITLMEGNVFGLVLARIDVIATLRRGLQACTRTMHLEGMHALHDAIRVFVEEEDDVPLLVESAHGFLVELVTVDGTAARRAEGEPYAHAA